MTIPIVSSFSSAILGVDLGRHLVDAICELAAVFDASHSAASAWLAKERSMTAAGWPSAALRFTRRPSASTRMRRDEPSWANDGELLDHRADEPPLALGHLLKSDEVDLDVEVTCVGEDRPVAHLGEVLGSKHLAVAGDGHEDLAFSGTRPASARPRNRP